LPWAAKRRGCSRGYPPGCPTVGPVRYEIAETVRLGCSDDFEAAAAVRAALDPWRPVAGEHPADVTIERLCEPPRLIEVQNPAGDGLVTGWSGSQLYIRAAGRWCLVPAPALGGPFAFACEPGFPVGAVMRSFVRPALQIAATAHGAIVVHGGSAVLDGRAVIVAGWSESGKTETVLALLEQGASFLSDKWTVVRADGTAACFPITVGIRRWMLGYAPRLRAALPAPGRLRLRCAAALATVARTPLRAHLIGRPAGDALERLVVTAERVSISPTALAAAYGASPPTETVPLGALVVLTTTPSGNPAAAYVDAAWAARRLARSATYERRSYLDLDRRARYAHASEVRADVVAEIEAREESRLRALFERIPVIEMRTPFPCDPRRIIEPIRSLL
jgi:hypothetical protein